MILKRLLKGDFNLWVLIAIFCFSRIFYYCYFGLRFDASPLPYYWQYLDIDLLKHHLIQSLFYLNSLTPGFNFFLGVVLKLFPNQYPEVFHLIYLAFGLLFCITLFLLMIEIGLNVHLSLCLTSLYITSPMVFEYENWLFYEYPSAALLSLSLLFLLRFSKRNEFSDVLTFFSLLAVIIYVRGLFSIYWFLFVLCFLLVIKKQEWKKIVLACAVPFLLIFALYFKNLMIFHSFSINDAQTGVSLGYTVIRPLPEAPRLVAEKKISGLYQILPFDTDFSKYAPYGIQPRITGIPALDEQQRPSGYPNTNNLVFIAVGQQEMKDALYVLKHYPRPVLTRLGAIFFEGYYGFSDECRPFYDQSHWGTWAQWDDFYKDFILGRVVPINYSVSKIGFQLLLTYGFFLIFRSFVGRNLDSTRGLIFIFMVMTIIYLMSGSFFIWQDWPRYRFLVDPFYLIFLGLFLNNRLKKYLG